MRKSFKDIHFKRWNHFSLGELQLLLHGLAILGEQNRVDFKLMSDQFRLRNQLRVAFERKVKESQP